MNTTRSKVPRALLWIAIPLALIGIGMICAWQLLPRVAPQLVIQYSPWIEPMLRAEAYETDGDAPMKMTAGSRHSLWDRITDEEWESEAIPHLRSALADRDLRVRQTAATHLAALRGDAHNPFAPATTKALISALADPDDRVFINSFFALLDLEEPDVASALFDHLPRRCKLRHPGVSLSDPIEWPQAFWSTEGEPHPLRALRLINLVDRIQPWLASNDDDLCGMACLVLRFSDDPKAVTVLDQRLGRHHFIQHGNNGRTSVFDPVAVALGVSTLPESDAVIQRALNGADSNRRRSAIRAVTCRTERPDAINFLPQIRALINDPDPDTRSLITACLLSFPLSQTIGDLTTIIALGGETARELITLISLDRVGKHRIRPWIDVQVSSSIDPDTPENWADEARVFAAFRSQIAHPDAEIRLAIAQYLCWTWEPDTKAALQQLANDPDLRIQKLATDELAKIGDMVFENPVSAPDAAP